MSKWPNNPFEKARRLFVHQASARILVLSGYPGRPEDYVEDRKVFAEILIAMLRFDGMMDPMKLRCVEHEYQWPERDLGVHVNHLLGQVQKRHDPQYLGRKFENHCDIGQKRNDDRALKPEMARACGCGHRLGAVMKRMHGPEKGHTMLQAMEPISLQFDSEYGDRER